MRKSMLTLLAVIPIVSLADTETVDGIVWNYTVSEGCASVGVKSTWGWEPSIETTTSGAITIPSELGGYPVVRINDRAFSCCTELEAVSIPPSVTSIGEYAFNGCTNIKLLLLPSSVSEIGNYAFFRCSGLESVTIPSSVSNIGQYLFYECSGLKSLVIKPGVTNIDYRAFERCSNLTSVSLPSTIRSVNNSAFAACYSITDVVVPGWKCRIDFSSVTNLVIAEGTTDIDEWAFCSCKKLMSVTMPNSVTNIGSIAFSDCDDLTSIVIPPSVISIGDSAFSGCSGLMSVVFPTNMMNIGAYAFSECTNLVLASIPSGVVNIGKRAFNGCSKITSLTIPVNVEQIGDYAFSGCPLNLAMILSTATNISAYAFSGCMPEYAIVPGRSCGLDLSLVSNLTIAEGTTRIEDCAFRNCSRLTSITMPTSVKNIGRFAFSECSTLKSINIPDSVTNIESEAFSDCRGLTFIAIPSSVINIGSDTFSGCSGLLSVGIPLGVTHIEGSAFSGCSSLTSVEIPSSVTEIGRAVFSGCTSLTNLILPFVGSRRGNTGTSDALFGYLFGTSEEDGTDLVYQYYFDSDSVFRYSKSYMPLSLRTVLITDETIIGSGAFCNCGKLTSVTIPPTVTNFESYAFYNCGGLSSIIIPNGVTNIGYQAFYSCGGLSSIDIPANVIAIGDSAFNECTGIANFKVSADNPNYSSKNGLLLSKDGQCLLHGINVVGTVTIPSGVTSIAKSAFKGCDKVTFVDIPASVTNIGAYAFSYSSISSLVIPPKIKSISESSFYRCRELQSLTLPEGVTNIENEAFYECKALSYISIPVSLIDVDYFSFYGCYAIKDAVIPGWDCRLYLGSVTNLTITEGTENVVAHAFSGCGELRTVTIPSSVTNIGEFAFRNCGGLEEFRVSPSNRDYCSKNRLLLSIDGTRLLSGVNGDVVIPSSVTSICDYAFSRCAGLTSVAIPVGVKDIGLNAFSQCNSITDVIVPGWKCCMDFATVTNLVIAAGTEIIPDYAFSGCAELKSVTIPASVTNIGKYAFRNCGKIEYFNVSSENEYYRSENRMLLTSDGARLICGVNGAVTIPLSVTHINEYAFSFCSKLTSISLPKNIRSIGDWTFYSCSELTSVTIPCGVTNLGECAFYGCSKLSSLTIPSSVIDIKNNAFSGCNMIRDITIPGLRCGINYASVTNLIIPDGTVKIDDSAFSGCHGPTNVKIPSSVESIGRLSFSDCSGLSSVDISSGVMSVGDEAFSGCSGLKSVTVPNSVTNIGAGAFAGCTSLTNMVLPFIGAKRGNTRTVDAVFGYVFGTESGDGLVEVKQCYADNSYVAYYIPTSLRTVEIADETVVGDGAFNNCSGLASVWILDRVISVGNCAFKGCNGLTLVAIPEGVTIIGDSAFSGCSSLMLMDIPTSVTEVGNCAFMGCCAIKSITLPEGLEAVGFSAFADCSGLTSVVVPTNVTMIGRFAFSGCTSLTNMVLPFVGARRGNTEEDSLFGYVFGGSPCEGTIAVKQHYCYSRYYYNYATYYIPASLHTVTISDETSISYGAFYGCSGLTSVMLNGSVTDIGAYAFYNCSGLTSMIMSEGVVNVGSHAFNSCSSLTEVKIPDTVTSIGECAFYNCSGMTSITIPSNVRSLGRYAFGHCRELKSVAIMSNATEIIEDMYAQDRYSSFYGCDSVTDVIVPGWQCGINFSSVTNLVIADGTTSIGDSAFTNCTKIQAVTIPSSVVRVGASAFANCQAIKSVTIPNNVANICEGAFSGCTSLIDMRLPFVGARRGNTGMADALFGHLFGTNAVDGLMEVRQCYSDDRYVTHYIPASLRKVEITDETVIGDGAFCNCSALTSIGIPSSVTNIGIYAFYNCQGLTSLTIPEGVTSVERLAFSGCSGLLSMIIPAGVTNIGESAFSNCSGLLSVTLPTGLANIGLSAFSGCRGLTCVVIPEGVTTIGISAFANCSSLSSVSLPEGLDTIGANAFEGCSALVTANIPSTVKELNAVPTAMLDAMDWDENDFKIQDGWVLDYRDKAANELIVPEGVVGIGCGALSNMEDLESASLPSTLKYISRGAFELDTYLDNVEIPDGVEIIGENAFKDCSYIQTISFGAGLKQIGDGAFDGCTQFAAVSFNEGLETIGEYAFNGCWRMQSILLPLSVKQIASTAFTGCDSLTGVTVPTHQAKMSEWFAPVYKQIVNASIPKGETEVLSSMFENCSALQTIEFVEGITNVASRAFYSCGNLRSIELPCSLETVGGSAFYGCGGIAAVVLPESVVEIGDHCFYNCSSVRELTLSRSLRSIPDSCFENCWGLQSFVVPASVTSIGANFCSSCLTAIYYLGNAPTVAADAYRWAWSLTSYVINGTKGWDGRATSRDLPSSWPVDNSYSRPIAFWTANEFDVTFDANGGIFIIGETNQYACAQITYTSYSLPPYEPILGGAKFGGYWTEPSGGTRVTASTAVKLTKAHTLYAHWDVAPSITVRFNANGGTIAEDSAVYTSGVPYGILPVATREHYNFAGWYTAAKGGMPVVISSEVPYADKELYAHWLPKLYEILYHSCDGNDVTVSQLFTYGDVVTLVPNHFICAGCNFVGWALSEGGAAVYANGANLGEVSAIQDGTINLYAVWSGRTYAVRFDSNGGKGSMENQTFVLGVAQHLNVSAFSREGYDFAGWAMVPSGNAVYEDSALAVGLTEIQGATVDLFAVWTRKGLSLAESFGLGMTNVVVSGDADWISDAETTHDGVASVRNAELAPAVSGKTTSTTFVANIVGSGSGSFWWKVSCEEDYYGEWYDFAIFAIDGVEQERIAGEIDWTLVEYSIDSVGAHTLTWTFVRDDFDEPDAEYDNRLWLDDFIWNRDVSSYTTADILNASELAFDSGGDAEWIADPVTNHDGIISLRSGVITHSQESWLETSVSGIGELSFWWKACGQVNGSRVYDYLKVELDGELVSRIGIAEWTNLVIAVTNSGAHIVRWTYLKNATINPACDCGWLDEVKWTKAQELSVVVPAGITGKADIVIPPAWFARFPHFKARFGGDFAAAMLKPNGKPIPGGGVGCVWHDYVAGTDPTDANSRFKALIRFEDGQPKITWDPVLDTAEAAQRSYQTYGKPTLADEWEPVTDVNRDKCHFFKVTVEMK